MPIGLEILPVWLCCNGLSCAVTFLTWRDLTRVPGPDLLRLNWQDNRLAVGPQGHFLASCVPCSEAENVNAFTGENETPGDMTSEPILSVHFFEVVK